MFSYHFYGRLSFSLLIIINVTAAFFDHEKDKFLQKRAFIICFEIWKFAKSEESILQDFKGQPP
jgi:hypothetical protein